MTDTDLHWVAWLIVFAVGLPMLVFVMWKRRMQARSGLFWRAVICLIISGIIAPIGGSEDFGGFTTIDIFPAIAVFPCGLWDMLFYRAQSSAAEFFRAFACSLLSILLVSSVLLGVWSAVIRSRSGR